MKCPECNEEIDWIKGHIHSDQPSDRQLLASNMCRDFGRIMEKAGFKIACVAIMDKVAEDSIPFGALGIILSFGEGMDSHTAASLLKVLGNQADSIMTKAKLVK